MSPAATLVARAGDAVQADVGRDVAKRAVAQVLEEQRRRIGVDDQQVDVAAVVEVGRHDRDRVRRRREAGGARDVGEGAVAVVAQQLNRRAGKVSQETSASRAGAGACAGDVSHADDDQIEIAVVIDVDQRGRRGQKRIGRDPAADGHIRETAAALVVVQAAAAVAQHEDVGRPSLS